MRGETRRPHSSRGKQLLFVSLVCAFLVAFAELSSLAGLWFVAGQVSFADLHRQQDRVANAKTMTAASHEIVHPYLGWMPNPYGNTWMHRFGLPMNDFGFEGVRSPLRRRTDGSFIIAIVGGSVAQQFARQGAEPLERALKRSPRFRDREIEIVNLAMYSYKQPQQLFAIQYFLTLGAEFDAVINIDGYNETAVHPPENGKKHVFMAYPRAWYNRVWDYPDPRVAWLRSRMWATTFSRRRWADWFNRLRFRYSPTANFIWLCRDRFLDDSARQDNIALLSVRLDQQRDYLKTGPEREYENDDAMFDDLVAFWRRCSIQLNRVCGANDIEYHHFLQPNQYLEGSKPMGPEERETAVLADSPYGAAAAQAYPRLIESGAELASQGVRFHDLTGLFGAVTEPIYVDNCCHYNEQGDELLAVAIAAAMVDDSAPPRR